MFGVCHSALLAKCMHANLKTGVSPARHKAAVSCRIQDKSTGSCVSGPCVAMASDRTAKLILCLYDVTSSIHEAQTAMQDLIMRAEHAAPGHPGSCQVAVLKEDPVALCGGYRHQGLCHRPLPLPQTHHVQLLTWLHPLLLPKSLRSSRCS